MGPCVQGLTFSYEIDSSNTCRRLYAKPIRANALIPETEDLIKSQSVPSNLIIIASNTGDLIMYVYRLLSSMKMQKRQSY